jgi:hypothetical protein
MPRLGSLLVCEKLIVDQQNKPTLISLFQSISALVPQGQEVPKDMIAGTPWTIFCEWFFTDEEEMARPFDQVVEVMLPDGSPSPLRGRLTFQEKDKSGQGTRSYVHMFGMPVAQVGFLTINVWLESDSQRVTDIFPYLIKVEHSQQSAKPGDGGILVPALSQTKSQ